VRSAFHTFSSMLQSPSLASLETQRGLTYCFVFRGLADRLGVCISWWWCGGGRGVQSFEASLRTSASLMQKVLCARLSVHRTWLATAQRGASQTVKLQGPSQIEIRQYATVWPNSFVGYCFSVLFPCRGRRQRPASGRCNSPGTIYFLLWAPGC